MYTIPNPSEIPVDAVMVVLNGDGTVTVYEAGDTLPEEGGNG